MEEKLQWLPTSIKEVRARGWENLDIILFTGDAYIDHPSFGTAIVGRLFESLGFKVAVVPQPNWRDDLRDFKKLGRPNLFFGVNAGSMDSMVNHYTASKRKRSDDAYTPEGKTGFRPDMPTIVYTQILKQLYPDVPVMIGGIEASLRRLTHYDYWKDTLKPSILFESGADMLVYGMGEKPLTEICRLLKKGVSFDKLTNIPQTCIVRRKDEKYATNPNWETKQLYSYEESLQDKKKYAINFRIIEEESNSLHAAKLIEPIKNSLLIVNPPYPPLSSKELDKVYDLPYTRLPHPRYKGKEIPAYNMIKHSVTLHRGCFGGCSFCTISAHQGKFISSRSLESINKEVEKITKVPDFRGTISDLGGPSANMYAMKGIKEELCQKCKRPSCIYPNICKNLNTDHSPLLQVYKNALKIEGIKHAFIGSGIRYDICLHKTSSEQINKNNINYLETVIRQHTSGRLKVAPEHTEDKVLNCMRKPSFNLFFDLKRIFDNTNKKYNLNQQLIPYFISSHPGCDTVDMATLAMQTRDLNFKLEQVQDFTPTPMTLATTIFYTGYHPYSLEKVYCAKEEKEKKEQNMFFFWYKKEYRDKIQNKLLSLKRKDLLHKLLKK